MDENLSKVFFNTLKNKYEKRKEHEILPLLG